MTCPGCGAPDDQGCYRDCPECRPQKSPVELRAEQAERERDEARVQVDDALDLLADHSSLGEAGVMRTWSR